jgi:hypothetical protein
MEAGSSYAAFTSTLPLSLFLSQMNAVYTLILSSHMYEGPLCSLLQFPSKISYAVLICPMYVIYLTYLIVDLNI